MIISKGHKQFADFIRLMQVVDVDNSVKLIDDPHPGNGDTAVLTLLGIESERSVEINYSAEKCELGWMPEIGDYRIIPLDDLSMVVARVISYLDGFTSRDLSDIAIKGE